MYAFVHVNISIKINSKTLSRSTNHVREKKGVKIKERETLVGKECGRETRSMSSRYEKGTSRLV